MRKFSLILICSNEVCGYYPAGYSCTRKVVHVIYTQYENNIN